MVSPQELAEQGKVAYQKGDYDGSARIFDAARDAYASIGDTLNAAEMANNRSVALLQAGDAKGAFDAVQGTAQIFADGGDTRRQAMALGNLGSALQALGRSEEAMDAYQKSADLFKEIGEHDLRAPVLELLAALQIKTGKHLQGVANMQAGLNEVEHPTKQQKTLKKLLSQLMKQFGL